MPLFDVSYTYDTPRYASMEIEAISLEDAEVKSVQELTSEFGVTGFSIDEIVEVKVVA